MASYVQRALRLISLLLLLAGCASGQALPANKCESPRPIKKANLISALQIGRSQRKTAATFVTIIECNGVDFQLTAKDELNVRRVGRYLGKDGLNNLVAALRANFRAPGPAPVPAQEKPIMIRLTCSGHPVRSGRADKLPFLISLLKDPNAGNSTQQTSLAYLRFYYLKKLSVSYEMDSNYLDDVAEVLPGCPLRDVDLFGQKKDLDNNLDRLGFKERVGYIDYPFTINDVMQEHEINIGPKISLLVTIREVLFSAQGEVEYVSVKIYYPTGR